MRKFLLPSGGVLLVSALFGLGALRANASVPADCKFGQTATIEQTAPGEYGPATGSGVNRLASFVVSPSDGGPVQFAKAFTRVNRGIVRVVVKFNNGSTNEVNKYCHEDDGARTYFDSIYVGDPDTIESVTVWVINT